MVAGNQERLQKFWNEGVEEPDEDLRARIAARLDPSWWTEHDVEAAFEKVFAAERRGDEEVARL